ARGGMDESRQASQSVEQTISTALELFRRSQGFLRAGQWSEYGETIRKLEEVLQELANRAKRE
ncbi:MAG: hypothetical protein ACREIQ_06380, partial [Nitrospiria bacterium]